MQECCRAHKTLPKLMCHTMLSQTGPEREGHGSCKVHTLPGSPLTKPLLTYTPGDQPQTEPVPSSSPEPQALGSWC